MPENLTLIKTRIYKEAGFTMHQIFDFDTFFTRWHQQPRNTVYVISDSELAEYKRKNTEREIAELDRLIDGHKSSIERIETIKADLVKALPETKEKDSQ